MYLHFTPLPVQWFFHRYTWRRNTAKQKIIFLTFDDGPLPVVTPFVLEVLERYQAKATFFCVGENVRKYPEILKQVTEAGHSVGNHTYNHLNGLRTSVMDYLKNTMECDRELESITGVRPKLFRPPYGRIRKEQADLLLTRHKIIMWDVLTADFDRTLSPEECLKKSIRYTRNGSIVVFHDSLKAFRNLTWVLPRYLEHFSAIGFSFKSL